jgi:hypothetical protein
MQLYDVQYKILELRDQGHTHFHASDLMQGSLPTVEYCTVLDVLRALEVDYGLVERLPSKPSVAYYRITDEE